MEYSQEYKDMQFAQWSKIRGAIVDKSRGAMDRRPIRFKAWTDLHEYLEGVENSQQWIREAVYEKMWREQQQG